MARRNEHTKEEIRQMAIISGQDIIKKEGFAAFSARKIARDIGYTIGTLYNIFASHEDIILHINAKTLDGLKKFIEENKSNKKHDANHKIKELARIYIQFAGQNYNCWNAIFEFHEPLDFVVPKWYEEKTGELFEIVEDALCGVVKGKRQLNKHAKILWASIHGICLLNIKQKLNIDGIKKVETLTDTLINNYLYALQNK